MNTQRSLLASIALIGGGLLLSSVQPARSAARPRKSKPALDQEARDLLKHQPMSFEANQGQSDPQVRFLARGAGYTVFLTPQEAVLSLVASGAKKTASTLRMQLVGANPKPEITGTDALQSTVQYFHGADPKKWQGQVPVYSRVKYGSVYPGVDLVYYGNQRRLEYDFHLEPGVDPAKIRLQFQGTKRMELTPDGDLVLHTPDGRQVHQPKPVCYQEIDGRRVPVDGNYLLLAQRRPGLQASRRLDRNPNTQPLTLNTPTQVGFKLAAYDRSRPVVIDPYADYTTYIGGNGYDTIADLVQDQDGYIYLTGSTDSANFPLQNGFQGNLPQSDAFVMKLGRYTSSPSYCTYLGGNGNDAAESIAVDGSGRAYITGITTSSDYLGKNRLLVDQPGNDAFVTVLDTKAKGVAALIYSTYLGGNSHDEGRAIAVDANGYAYVTGITFSSNFPAKNAYKTTRGGIMDMFVTKLNPAAVGAASLLYSTYLGGSDDDTAWGIAIDGTGRAYVAGSTSSLDFPVRNSYQSFMTNPADPDHRDAAVAEMNTTLSGNASLEYGTYLGGSGADEARDIVMGTGRTVYLAGSTPSADFPHTGPVSTYAGKMDAWVAKLDTGAPAGRGQLLYSETVGGTDNDYGYCLAFHSNGLLLLAGPTTSTDLPIAPYYPGLGNQDCFVAVFDLNRPATNSLVDAIYLGGSDYDWPTGIAFTADGEHFVLAGSTASSDLPLVAYLNPVLADQPADDGFLSELNLFPLGPKNLTATLIAGPKIVLNWEDTSYSEAGYRLDIVDLSGDPRSVFLPANTTTYTNTLVSAGKTYGINVWAENSAGSSSSNGVSITVSAPPAPSGLTAAAAASPLRIELNWADNSNNESSFDLQRKRNTETTYQTVATLSPNVTHYTDTAVSANVYYNYRVRAVNVLGGSAFSIQSAVATTTLPTIPANFRGTPSSPTSVLLQWDDRSNNEERFRIERLVSGSWTLVLEVPADRTQQAINGLGEGASYTFRILAMNSIGSSAAIQTTVQMPPAAPTGLSIPARTESSVRLAWTDGSQKETGFKIERQIGNGGWVQVGTVGANVLSYLSTGLAAQTTYHYRVSAYVGTTNSTSSNTVDVITP